jgi:hypothetical protein
MKQIVFYSWQSDLPNSCNRGFIQKCLEAAVATIKSDESVAVEPVVDRDTQGVSGAPDIVATILAKITAADVFVADVSIINGGQERPTPNPNVLVELGYALKALGHERIVLVFNRAFGKVESLPFDLKMRRALVYELSAGEPKATESKALERQLEQAVRSALGTTGKNADAPPIPAVSAIENQQPNRNLVLRRNLEQIFKRIDSLEPKRLSEGGSVEELISAIGETQEPAAEFSKIAEIIAAMNDSDAALELYRGFGRIFERYDIPQNFAGRFSSADQDFFKFVGHELFVTFVAFLLKEQRWDLLGTVLNEPIPVRYLRQDQGPGSVAWHFASEHLVSLMDEGGKRRRTSLHADILNERHTNGGLAAIMPMAEFAAADYFLFLFGDLPPEQAGVFLEWRPWSTLYLRTIPLFLRSAESKKVAEQIMKLFHIPSTDEFRKRFSERADRVEKLFRGAFWDSPVRPEDITYFGTR